jgi:Uma2 family endonuclease
MTRTKCRTEQPPMVLRTRPALEMDDEQLFEFCRINREWRIERRAEGELEIMPPAGGETSNHNFKLVVQLGIWTARASRSIPAEALSFPASSWTCDRFGSRGSRSPACGRQ